MKTFFLVLLFALPVFAGDYEDFDVTSVMFGGGSDEDKARARDIFGNDGANFLKEVEAKIAAGKEVLLIGETYDFSQAAFTTITKIAGSGKFRVTYRRLAQKESGLSKETLECLKRYEPISRAAYCYNDDFQQDFKSEAIDDLAFIVDGRFTDYFSILPFEWENIKAAAEYFKADVTPIKHLADDSYRYYDAMLANGLYYDWTEPLYWKIGESPNATELYKAKKFYAATVRLKTDDLYYGTYNLQCSIDGEFPGPGKSKIKTDTMIAGPILLNYQEYKKFVVDGECHHYAVGIPDNDLYKLLMEMGYTYDDAKAIWTK